MSDLLKALTPTPTGWSNNTNYCKWKGISCDSSQSVTSIVLPSSSLSGTLPPNINCLTNLNHIDLHNNSLYGPLPSFYGLFFNLQTISLGHNNFTLVPAGCFYGIYDLRTLNLSNNLNLKNWVFPIKDLANSGSLHTLDLEATNMMGDLQSEMFDSFPNLHTFIISHNQIGGNLPQSLRKSAVRYLQLDNQGGYGIGGTIDVISSMSNLSQAWLHENSFTGRIPNMSKCTNLSDLQLQSNYLSGLVPPSLLALSSLNIISLDNNILQGPRPVFHKGVKATLEPNYFCRSDVGPCDSQVMILLEISEAFERPGLLLIKGNNACTGTDEQYPNRGLIRCERGKIVSIDLGICYQRELSLPHFPI
ncbi:putative receptor protein kinase TMK1-like [Trifolium medium]|uniref:Putative receptor protein kinase TMK1-like n=1 Tax=Trifolium medium TaxID=97028 RepID=A0A392MK20_9FABA|nr:putative receptor protein kinase TMK1-like [Trifolium medium]